MIFLAYCIVLSFRQTLATTPYEKQIKILTCILTIQAFYGSHTNNQRKEANFINVQKVSFILNAGCIYSPKGDVN